MTNVFRANAEQQRLMDACKALERQFNDQPMLHGSATKIAEARSLIGEASAAGVPTAAYVGLQIAVSTAESDASVPEKYRQFKPLP